MKKLSLYAFLVLIFYYKEMYKLIFVDWDINMKINTATTFAFITLVFANLTGYLIKLAGYLIKDAYAVTCFKQYERISGMNKICVYNCLGSDRTITIKSYQLCPLSING